MNLTEKQAIINLVVANGNLQIAICKDDPSEVLKAIHHLETAQVQTGVALYNAEQILGIESAAKKRMNERFGLYGVPSNA